jgi:hypothetical protein
VIHVDYVAHYVTIIAEYYSNAFRNDVYQAIWKKILGKLSK